MKQAVIRITTGAIITIVGIGALLGALNLIPFWGWFGQWWPTLIIIAGAFVLISDLRRNYLWGTVLLVVGTLMLLRSLSVIDFDFFSLIIPILIIAAGLSVMIQAKNRKNIPTNSKNSDDISSIFSGNESINSSKNYEGGSVTAIFGGSMLDLRDATIKDTATLDVFALCGGIELKVPRDWQVVVKTTAIAGGVENRAYANTNAKAPKLVITGTVLLGGVEIKT